MMHKSKIKELLHEQKPNSEQKAGELPSAQVLPNPMLAEALCVKPILFSRPMVEAIIDGSKTQTRRIINSDVNNIQWQPIVLNGYGGFCDEHGNPIKPKYKIGDIVWVRETFYAYGRWVKNGLSKTGKQKYKFNDFTLLSYSNFQYKYEDCKPQRIKTGKENEIGWYKRPSLFMPKKACRLFIKIEDVAAEKVQSISKEDAIKEGLKEFTKDGTVSKYGLENWIWSDMPRLATNAFGYLWSKINGKESWDENPFVWVYSFKRAECPQGFC